MVAPSLTPLIISMSHLLLLAFPPICFLSVSVDRPAPDSKPTKPAAPVVPPKKPVPPPGKGRPGSFPPKRPDKPLVPSPNLK